MQDIIDQLRTGLDQPPAPPAGFGIDATVAAGRRVVRRRRAAAAVGGVLGAVVLAGVVGLAGGTGGGQPDTGVEIAAGVPSGGLQPTTDLPENFPVDYVDSNGNDLLIQDGWTVVERITGPMDGLESDSEQPIVASDAVAVRKNGEEIWVLLHRFEPEVDDDSTSQGGGGIADPDGSTTFPDLATWVDFQADVLTTSSTDDLVAFDDAGQLQPKYGVRLVREGEPLASLNGGVPVLLRVGAARVWGVAHHSDDTTILDVATDYPAGDDGGSLAGFVDHLEGRS